MARTRTLQQLIASVRWAADLEGQELRHTDERIVEALDQSRIALRVLVSDHGDSYYLVKSPAATVAAGSDSIDIAATFVYYPTPESAPEQVDIIHIYGLDIQVGTEWQEVNKYQLAERNDYEGYTGPAEVFRERDTNILDIRPALDADYSLRLWYLPPGTDFAELSTFDGAGGLSSSTATFDGISGWEDWLIYDAGIRCATRDAGVADNLPDLRSELARHEKHILSSSRKRVRVTALRRLDTRGRRYALSRRNRWGFSP